MYQTPKYVVANHVPFTSNYFPFRINNRMKLSTLQFIIHGYRHRKLIFTIFYYIHNHQNRITCVRCTLKIHKYRRNPKTLLNPFMFHNTSNALLTHNWHDPWHRSYRQNDTRFTKPLTTGCLQTVQHQTFQHAAKPQQLLLIVMYVFSSLNTAVQFVLNNWLFTNYLRPQSLCYLKIIK